MRRTSRRGVDASASTRQNAGHSLRSMLATSVASAGGSERSIMNQRGHKRLPMVRRYIRDGLFRENAAGVVGL